MSKNSNNNGDMSLHANKQNEISPPQINKHARSEDQQVKITDESQNKVNTSANANQNTVKIQSTASVAKQTSGPQQSRAVDHFSTKANEQKHIETRIIYRKDMSKSINESEHKSNTCNNMKNAWVVPLKEWWLDDENGNTNCSYHQNDNGLEPEPVFESVNNRQQSYNSTSDNKQIISNNNEEQPFFESVKTRRTQRYYNGGIDRRSNSAGLTKFLQSYEIKPAASKLIRTKQGAFAAKNYSV